MKRLMQWIAMIARTAKQRFGTSPETRKAAGGVLPAADAMPPVFTGRPHEYPDAVKAAIIARQLRLDEGMYRHLTIATELDQGYEVNHG